MYGFTILDLALDANTRALVQASLNEKGVQFEPFTEILIFTQKKA